MASADRSAAMASAMLQFRRRRAEVLPSELFGEPAWDLLLELFLADAQSRRLTGHDVCGRSGVSEPVMSRWLMHLTRLGLIVGDGSGDLRDALTLSGSALGLLEEILGQAVASQPAAT